LLATNFISETYGFGSFDGSIVANKQYIRRIKNRLYDPKCDNFLTNYFQKTESNYTGNNENTNSAKLILNENQNDNEGLSLCLNSRKWITADGYNLKTFNQTEGRWSVEHPLPLPTWTKNSKQPFIIENVSNGSRM
jgi:hypothetical protein